MMAMVQGLKPRTCLPGDLAGLQVDQFWMLKQFPDPILVDSLQIAELL
jgi:hypothetical protein